MARTANANAKVVSFFTGPYPPRPYCSRTIPAAELSYGQNVLGGASPATLAELPPAGLHGCGSILQNTLANRAGISGCADDTEDHCFRGQLSC
jgi:hypothetical protein